MGIKREIVEVPTFVESANVVVDGMRQDAKTGDVYRRPQRRAQRKKEQRSGVSLALVVFVNGELPKQCDRHGIRLVPLLRLRQKCPFNLT